MYIVYLPSMQPVSIWSTEADAIEERRRYNDDNVRVIFLPMNVSAFS